MSKDPDGPRRNQTLTLAAIAACLAQSALAQSALAQPALAQPAPQPPDVVVSAASPLPGAPIDADKLPGEVQTLSVQDLTRDRPSGVLPNLAAGQMADVSLNDEQGSPFQPDFVYRGFEASPISGVAEGVAVYQDGVRLNEAFGDSVNWDLIPEFAVRTFSVASNNPVFGLNSLGGVVTLAMKDGFSQPGLEAEASAGAFGNVSGHVEAGDRVGALGFYLGAGALHDDGFRDHSPATLRQTYGDLAFDQDRLTLHLSATGVLNDIAAVGPTPAQLLAADRRAVFTYPQAMRNGMGMVQLRGEYRASPALSLSGSLYFRRFDQVLTDGNTTDVAVCANNPGQFCLEGAGLYPNDALHGANGAPVPTSVLPPGSTPGEIDTTHTRTTSLGGAVQAALSAPIGGHADSLVLGAAVDHGQTRYDAHGELGALQPDLRVVGSGVIIDQALSPTAQPPLEAPVSVLATNTYVGLYGINVLDLTPRLAWTLSGRLNRAEIGLADRLGDTLNGRHGFGHFNPGTGLTYKLTPDATAYVGYSQSNRAPTAGELSCANPASPCLLDAFLVSDPGLKPVISTTYEAGLRGRFAVPRLTGGFTWTLSAYRTDAADDILLLATNINGFGYFQNAGATRRQGLDVHIGYRGPRLTLNASYAWLDARFLSPLTLSSNSPAADVNGLIQVRPGDRLPLQPAHRLTLSADYAPTPRWSVGADLRGQSSQYLVGDASNQEPPLAGYAVAGLRGAYRLGERAELFAQIENLFDRRYATYGAFTSLNGLPPHFNLTDPRVLSPAEGRSVSVGARVRLF